MAEEEYPRNLMELEANFGTEEGVSVIPGATAVANRFRVSTLRVGEGVARARSVGMRPLRRSDFGDHRDDFSGHQDATTGVVSRHVVGDNPEERRQRLGSATRAGAEEVRDGLDVASQIAPRHGKTGA